MNTNRFGYLLYAVIGAATLILSADAAAEDWPMFGHDHTRNAVSPEKNPPTDWQIEWRDEKGNVFAPDRNVKWKAKLGSYTFGSPVISGGLVWVCTNNAQPRDPGHKDDMACLMCFDEATGNFRWQYLTARIGNRYVDFNFLSVDSTPLVEGDRLWFITNRWEVVCLDIGPLLKGTGEAKELWKIDMPRDLGIAPFSAIMSASVRCKIGASYHGMIYIITGNGGIQPNWQHFVQAPDAPSLICVDKDTGKVIWKDKSPGEDIITGQWSSPLVAEINGRMQVIAAQGDGWMRGFDATTGKFIWKCDLNPKGSSYPETRLPIMAVPVLYQNRIYIAPGRQFDGAGGPTTLWCIDPTKEGDVSEELDDGPLPHPPYRREQFGGPRLGKPNPNSGVIWKFDRIPAPGRKAGELLAGMTTTTSSVVAADGLVIATTTVGDIHCLDARTGELYWVRDATSYLTGEPLICDGKLYVADEDGEILILALSRREKLLAIRPFGEYAVGSSPIIANGVLYVSTGETLYAIQESPKALVGEWPQWRGPDRANVARDTGLLDQWPAEGPPLLWKASGLGSGGTSVAVVHDRVYTLGYRGDGEFLVAREASAGKNIWEARVGPMSTEAPALQRLGQRTPTVDEDRVYVVTVRGELVCISTADGAELWRKDYDSDFHGRAAALGYCDHPMVDGDRLICTPGGSEASMVALDKRTGATIWKCSVSNWPRATFSAVMKADVAGVQQYVQQLGNEVIGVGTNGHILWRYDLGGGQGNIHTALAVDGQRIFCSCGCGVGDVLLEFSVDNGGKLSVKRVPFGAGSGLSADSGNAAVVGEEIYTNDGSCLLLKTGRVAWSKKLGKHNSMMAAENHLYYRLGDGTVVLVEAGPHSYIERGRFLPPRPEIREATWSSPVVANHRLFLRDQDQLLCYDLRRDPFQPFAPPAAPVAVEPSTTTPPALEKPSVRRSIGVLFVPTPQDVVERMLALAGVQSQDDVYDLGCGDGRIVVTAARKYRCRATGIDLDPKCVRISRDNVQKENVAALVNIEEADILTQDLSKASVVTLYVGLEMNHRLLPQLSKLKPGSRIVSHDFPIQGFLPDQVVSMVSSEGRGEHLIYLFTTPLNAVTGAAGAGSGK